jgi:hypothetical protein
METPCFGPFVLTPQQKINSQTPHTGKNLWDPKLPEGAYSHVKWSIFAKTAGADSFNHKADGFLAVKPKMVVDLNKLKKNNTTQEFYRYSLQFKECCYRVDLTCTTHNGEDVTDSYRFDVQSPKSYKKALKEGQYLI